MIQVRKRLFDHLTFITYFTYITYITCDGAKRRRATGSMGPDERVEVLR